MNPGIPDFIRKQYDHEIDRQDKIVSNLSLPSRRDERIDPVMHSSR